MYRSSEGYCPEITEEEEGGLTSIEWRDLGPVEGHQRIARASSALNRRREHRHDFVLGQKYCITPGDMFSWESRHCLSSTWVVVHGMETICMVIRRPQDVSEPVLTEGCIRTYTNKHQTMMDYATMAISEVEFLPYDDARFSVDFRFDDARFNVDYRFQQLRHIKGKPFGVVSVVSDSKKKVDEESGHEYNGVSKASSFLREKMTSGLAFTFDETVQTAISAFQHLCPDELKAEDIWVTTLMMDTNQFEHMYLTQREQHLAVIRGNTCGVSGFTSDGKVPRTLFEYWCIVNGKPSYFYKYPIYKSEDTLQQSSNPTFPYARFLTSPFRTFIGQPSQSAAQDGFLSFPFRCSGQPSQSGAAENSPSDQFSDLTSLMSSLHLG